MVVTKLIFFDKNQNSYMKKIIISLFLASSSLLMNAQSLANISAKNLKGETVSLSQLSEEKPLVLSFWATWCLPCLEEQTSVNEKIEEWKKEKDFNYVAVSVDDPRTVNKVKSVVNGKNWNFDEVLLDPSQSVKRKMNINNVPTTLVFYKNKLVYSHVGYALGDEDELYAKVKEIQ